MYVHGSHLGHVTSIMLLNFHFHVLKAYIQNLVKNGPVVFEKSKFQFSYVMTLGQGQEMTLTFINSISGLHLPTFRSHTAIVSEKSTVSLFPIEKPRLQNLTLP